MKEIEGIEKEYLETHPDSGYLIEVMNLKVFHLFCEEEIKRVTQAIQSKRLL